MVGGPCTDIAALHVNSWFGWNVIGSADGGVIAMPVSLLLAALLKTRVASRCPFQILYVTVSDDTRLPIPKTEGVMWTRLYQSAANDSALLPAPSDRLRIVGTLRVTAPLDDDVAT